MPKGEKVLSAVAPESAGCDFCGRRFKPLAWNERTCFSCGSDGAPNQSKLEWGEYQRVLRVWLRGLGRLPALKGAAASTAPLRGRPFAAATRIAGAIDVR